MQCQTALHIFKCLLRSAKFTLKYLKITVGILKLSDKKKFYTSFKQSIEFWHFWWIYIVFLTEFTSKKINTWFINTYSKWILTGECHMKYVIIFHFRTVFSAQGSNLETSIKEKKSKPKT